MLWAAEVVVVAADAELCAEQTLTALAAAANMIAALRCFVNFISINFPCLLLYPNRVELRALLEARLSQKEFAETDLWLRLSTWRIA